jgi:dTDP-4-amino-4,6-dideoxygalactose transaminase
VREFEEALARFLGGGYVIATNAGETALQLCLAALGIGAGHEVIVSPYVWGQVAAAVVYAGATPVFADIENGTGNLDPDAVAAAITPRTTAILVSHFAGHPADMTRLGELAGTHNLPIVEDCAQSLGGDWLTIPTGRWGHIACFSFGWRKPLCAGEGGAIYTSRRDLYERALALGQHPDRILRELGPERSVDYASGIGHSFRMHPLAAAAGLAELLQLQRGLERQRARHRLFSSLCAGLTSVQVAAEKPGARSAHYSALVTYCSDTAESLSRSTYAAALRAEGVPVAVGPIGRPLHLHPFFSASPTAGRVGAHPVAEKRCAHEEIALQSGTSWRNTPEAYVRRLAVAFAKVDEHLEDLTQAPDAVVCGVA